MVTQRFTWRMNTSVDNDMVKALTSHIGTIRQVNRHVTDAEIELYDDHIMVHLWLITRDRWWAQRKAPFLVASICTRVGIDTKACTLVDIQQEKDLKSARFYTSEGKRSFTPEQGEAPPAVDWGCKNCKKPAGWVQRSGWHQQYRGTGR